MGNCCVKLSPPAEPCRPLPTYPSQGYQPQPSPTMTQAPPTMTPSSSGRFYPGSNYPPSYGGSARQNSGASASSSISVQAAQETVEIIQRCPSIGSLARRISRDCDNLKGTAEELTAWRKALDPQKYKSRRPWPEAIEMAHEGYKELVEVFKETHQALNAHAAAFGRNTTPERHVERANLAIEWGMAAVKAAEGRLQFMETYRDAFEFHQINGHIQQGKDTIQSARNAVRDARLNYQGIWISAGQWPNASVFQ